MTVPAGAQHRNHEAIWPGVIEWTRVDEDGIRPETILIEQHGEALRRMLGHCIGDCGRNALGPPGGPRRIEHRRPAPPLYRGYGWLACKLYLVRRKGGTAPSISSSSGGLARPATAALATAQSRGRTDHST